GHHAPLAQWAREHGYTWMRVDGQLMALENFKPLARHKEHTIEIVVDKLESTDRKPIQKACAEALELGEGQACLLDAKGKLIQWLSTKRVDPTTGEAFPELDPKHFSWHSPQGWCETCLGTGVASGDDFAQDSATVCPSCAGARLNVLSRHVYIPLKGGKKISLPELLELNAPEFLQTLQKIHLGVRERTIANEILPAITE
ncbi:MAG TPA: hypothetical protein PLV25_03075, partial [Opitutales bacterium]|nr:hypothetical protein [Opitutales bacterium]